MRELDELDGNLSLLLSGETIHQSCLNCLFILLVVRAPIAFHLHINNLDSH